MATSAAHKCYLVVAMDNVKIVYPCVHAASLSAQYFAFLAALTIVTLAA